MTTAIIHAGRALGVLVAKQIAHLNLRRVRVLGPAEVVDEQYLSASLYLTGARQAAASLGLGGYVSLEPLLRSAEEIDWLGEWLAGTD